MDAREVIRRKVGFGRTDRATLERQSSRREDTRCACVSESDVGHAPGNSASSLRAEVGRTHDVPEGDADFLRPDVGGCSTIFPGARVRPPDTPPLGIEHPDGREVGAGDSWPLHRGVQWSVCTKRCKVAARRWIERMYMAP